MRALWGLVLLVGCDEPAPFCSASSCYGCCLKDTCYPGTGIAACGVRGNICDMCVTGQACEGGECVLFQGGGGGRGGGSAGGGQGGGGAGTGGGAQPMVFATMRWTELDVQRGRCPDFTYARRICSAIAQMTKARFDSVRLLYPSCSMTQIASDGYDFDCTNNCTSLTNHCFYMGTYPAFTQWTCIAPEGAYGSFDGVCYWYP